MLTSRVGLHHLALAEDAAQSAVLSALEAWRGRGVPDDPAAWLFRAASNQLVGELRQRGRRDRLLEQHAPLPSAAHPEEPTPLFAGDLKDDLLRMLFVCCDDELPVESQLVLALKILCGLDVREIAARLLTTEANVYKRLARGRDRLRENPRLMEGPGDDAYASRVSTVQAVLYVLFTEGHLSSSPEQALRQELCDEAIRLAGILASHPVGATPETFALLALMHLHRARMFARQDGSGGLLLLEEQDRTLWDMRHVQLGLSWLERSAQGEVFSRYHAEAGVAAEHCLAPTFADTRWDRVVACYELLERLAPSPLHTLNRAIAAAESQGPAKGLSVLEGMTPPPWLERSYLLAAVLSDLHRRVGNQELARHHREAALRSAPNERVKAALRRRLQGA